MSSQGPRLASARERVQDSVVPPDPNDEAFWRDFLTQGASFERRARQVFKRIPAEPRCRICAAPFAGVGAGLMRLIGKRPSESNPTTADAAAAAGLDPSLERRPLELKGKQDATEVVSLRVA
jgi:hypothetical protein